MPYSGYCLCKKVTLQVQQIKPEVSACHCNMCRRWSGGPLLSLSCGSDVEFDGHNSITRYASSEWAERGFCSQCGTHLFYYYKPSGNYFIPAALFGDDVPVTLTEQIFIDEKPDFYSFSQCTALMTGDDVIAAFTKKE